MKNDSLSDKMKNYEGRSQSHLPLRTYTMLRLDGKAFHTFTKGLKRPYDLELMSDMDNTAKYLCENIQGCKFGYVQSDEITLVLTDFDTIYTDAWFDGNVQKITSVSASMAAAKFNQLRIARILIPRVEEVQQRHQEFPARNDWAHLTVDVTPLIEGKLANFDSRCWVIPDQVEVYNCLLWRQQDATRNSIQMVGQANFSYKQLQNKSCNQIQEMLLTEKGIDWSDMPDGFKYGRCVIKETYETLDTFKNDGSLVTRSRWTVVDAPVFSQSLDFVWKFLPKISG